MMEKGHSKRDPPLKPTSMALASRKHNKESGGCQEDEEDTKFELAHFCKHKRKALKQIPRRKTSIMKAWQPMTRW